MGKQGFGIIIHSTNLHNGTKASNLDKHTTTALWVETQLAFAGAVVLTGVQRFLYRRFEVFVKMLHHRRPLLLAFGNLVEVLLHFGREVIVHDGGERIHEEVVDNDTHVSRQ